MRDGSTEPRIIEASACGVRERFWAVLIYPAHVRSSLVCDCFLYAGVDLLPGQVDVLVTPDDLANSPLLEEVESS